MHKLIPTLIMTSLLAAPAVTLAGERSGHRHHARSVARQECRAERNQIGARAFRAKYGRPDTFRRCVSMHVPSDRVAGTQCRAERRQIGAAAFRARYGTPHALNRCIAAKTRT